MRAGDLIDAACSRTGLDDFGVEPGAAARRVDQIADSHASPFPSGTLARPRRGVQLAAHSPRRKGQLELGGARRAVGPLSGANLPPEPDQERGLDPELARCVSDASTASRSTRSLKGSPPWPLTQRNETSPRDR